MSRAVRYAQIATWILLAVSLLPLLRTPWAILNVLFYVCVIRGLRRANPWTAFAAALITAINGVSDVTSLIETGSGSPPGRAISALLYASVALVYIGAGLKLRSSAPAKLAPSRTWMAYALTYSLISVAVLVLFQSYTVLTNDMAPTLLLGDYILVTRSSPTYVLKDYVLAMRFDDAPGVTFGRVAEPPGDLVQPETYVVSTDDRAGDPTHRLLVEPRKVTGQAILIYWSIDVPDPATAHWYELLWINTTRWNRMFRFVR